MFDKNLFEELNKIKMMLGNLEKNSIAIGDWIPKKNVQKFFDYSNTQMLVLEKENGLVTSKIKGRKFYSFQSILELLDKNKTKLK
jgi:hypothetical protein